VNIKEQDLGVRRDAPKSKALLGRRKSGKTAIMERLFNIVYCMESK